MLFIFSDSKWKTSVCPKIQDSVSQNLVIFVSSPKLWNTLPPAIWFFPTAEIFATHLYSFACNCTHCNSINPQLFIRKYQKYHTSNELSA